MGLVAALIAMPYLIGAAIRSGDLLFLIGSSVFATTVVLLYFASTLYHAWPPGRAKGLLQIFDHGAIFLLIAGTYTPFLLGVLRGAWGWSLGVLVWSLAVGGVLFKALRGTRHPRLSTALYLIMGWLLVVAIRPLWLHLPLAGLGWLALGGLSYTAGVVFFAAKRPYAHFVWHLFVLAGTACHFVAVRYYAG